MNGQGVQRNILYFSKQCPHCTRFRQMLVKKPDLESKFIQLCVDNGGNLPRYVKSVPFIVVNEDKGRQLQLTDGAAFNWLKDQMDQHAGDFEAYDSGAMSSTLSDYFSYIGADGNAGAEHTFEWLPGHKSERTTIMTPNETVYGGGLITRDQIPDDALEKINKQRMQDMQALTQGQKRPQNIDFTKPLSQQQQQILQETREQQQYTEQARKQDARIPQSRQGIDFADPNFQNKYPSSRGPPQQQPPRIQPQPQPHPGQVQGRGRGLRPVAAVRNAPIAGRRLPQNIPRK